jgi:hypothetical protein
VYRCYANVQLTSGTDPLPKMLYSSLNMKLARKLAIVKRSVEVVPVDTSNARMRVEV